MYLASRRRNASLGEPEGYQEIFPFSEFLKEFRYYKPATRRFQFIIRIVCWNRSCSKFPEEFCIHCRTCVLNFVQFMRYSMARSEWTKHSFWSVVALVRRLGSYGGNPILGLRLVLLFFFVDNGTNESFSNTLPAHNWHHCPPYISSWFSRVRCIQLFPNSPVSKSCIRHISTFTHQSQQRWVL